MLKFAVTDFISYKPENYAYTEEILNGLALQPANTR